MMMMMWVLCWVIFSKSIIKESRQYLLYSKMNTPWGRCWITNFWFGVVLTSRCRIFLLTTHFRFGNHHLCDPQCYLLGSPHVFSKLLSMPCCPKNVSKIPCASTQPHGRFLIFLVYHLIVIRDILCSTHKLFFAGILLSLIFL